MFRGFVWSSLVVMLIVAASPVAADWNVKGNLGALHTTGYTDTFSGSAGIDSTFRLRKNRLKLGSSGSYGMIRYPGGEFQEGTNNWRFRADYSRFITQGERPFLWFRVVVDGDEFKGYWLRAAPSLGIGYALVKNENIEWNVRLGANYTYEHFVELQDGEDTADYSEGIVESDYIQTVADNLEWSWVAQYYNQFEESEDYRVSFETSLTIKVNDVISLKQTFALDYQNAPANIAQLDADGNEVIDPATGEAFLVQGNRLDTTAALSIVLNFTRSSEG